MKPVPFDYFAPTSVEETCALLARHGDDAEILAAGKVWYSSCPTPRTSERLIDINPVRELDYTNS